MKVEKKTDEYTILKRADGRYAVKSAARKWINGDDKVAILVKEGLRKAPEPKAEPEPEAPEESAEADAGEEAAE